MVPAQRRRDRRVARRAGAASAAGVGARRGVGGRRQAQGGAVPVPPLPASTADQVASEAEAEAQIRRFYDDGGFLSQPAVGAPLPQRRAARLPRTAALPRRLRRSHRRVPSRRGRRLLRAAARPDLPYFYAANARDPRRGSPTRAPTTSSSRSATPTPTRSGGATTTPAPTRASPSTTRSTCCRPGCSTTPRTRGP